MKLELNGFLSSIRHGRETDDRFLLEPFLTMKINRSNELNLRENINLQQLINDKFIKAI